MFLRQLEQLLAISAASTEVPWNWRRESMHTLNDEVHESALQGPGSRQRLWSKGGRVVRFVDGENDRRAPCMQMGTGRRLHNKGHQMLEAAW